MENDDLLNTPKNVAILAKQIYISFMAAGLSESHSINKLSDSAIMAAEMFYMHIEKYLDE
jgi:hypothetical protein